MNESDLNEYEFGKMPVSKQRLVMFKNQLEIKEQVKDTNGKVKRHDKELLAIKVIGTSLLIWICIAAGTGIPVLPGF